MSNICKNKAKEIVHSVIFQLIVIFHRDKLTDILQFMYTEIEQLNRWQITNFLIAEVGIYR